MMCWPVSSAFRSSLSPGAPSPPDRTKRPHDAERARRFRRALLGVSGQRVTLPDFRQPVHTLRRFGVPLTTARTRWMFGLHWRLVFFFDHGTLWPKPGRLAQMSHTAAMGHSSNCGKGAPFGAHATWTE